MSKEDVDFILNEAKKGNVVFNTGMGLAVAPLDEFIQQPADGILYDLNRLEEVVMTFISDEKWINDYAVALVIRRLKAKLEEALSRVQSDEADQTVSSAIDGCPS